MLTHLEQLEAESIHIMREVVAECKNPAMLYSIGKDSAVMLHLAMKAFHPARPPFPLLHVDTTWKFREMIVFRDRTAKEVGFRLITYTNPRGLAEGVNPITHGSAYHTDVMKTEALKQALDLHGFDVAFGGARRDEEKSRAKERIFSFRAPGHRWEPKAQRPELWNLYNTRINPGETIRVFPLSNWTEADIVAKRRQTFANGWLGLDSFGRATFVAVAEITQAEYDAAVEALARHFVEAYGAPGLEADSGAIRAEAGQAPAFEVQTGSVEVGTREANVAVPKIEVSRDTAKVGVPSVEVRPAKEASDNAAD